MQVTKTRIYTTAGVSALVAQSEDLSRFVIHSLTRFHAGDWGDTCDEDKQLNDEAMQTGDARVLAVYNHPVRAGWKIWIILEADRSATTVLFPSEY